MATRKTAKKPGKFDEKLSLAPLTPEQALFKALNTPMPKKPAKKNPKKSG
jgi:hypothetical protein